MYRTLSFKTAAAVLAPMLKVRRPVIFIGSPGIGKTAMVEDLARALEMPCETIIASTCDSTDFGGFPVVRPDGAFDRIPMRQISNAAQRPSVLFFDEISCAPPPVQAALLRGLHGRVFGDVALHPETVMIAAANPPEQAAGGSEFAAPLINRFAAYNFVPTIEEVRDYFDSLGDEGSALRELALDWSATTQHAPDLIQFDPPPASVNEGAQWATPRGWEWGLRACAEIGDTGPAADDLMYDLLAGNVGEAAAASYMGVRKLRVHLPSVPEILKDPAGAKVPKEIAHQIGAIGLLANVASTDAWAAWVYTERLADEVATAAGRALMSRARSDKSKHATAGRKAMTKILGRVGRNL